MGFSRPFNQIALIVIGVFLLALTGLLASAYFGDARPPKVAENSLVPTATASVEASSAVVDGPAPPAATPKVTLPPADDTTQPHETVQPDSSSALGDDTGTPAAQSTAPAAQSTTPAVQVAPTADPSPTAPADDWQRVQVPPAGVAFELPSSWQRVGAAWKWSAAGSDGGHVGFAWSEAVAPAEMLPNPASIVDVRTINLGWTEGNRFQIELFQDGELVALENHAIVQLDDDLTGDFYSSGLSLTDLASLDPVLDRMLSTMTYRAAAGGPIETCIGFLTALMQDPAGVQGSAFLSDRRQGESALVFLDLQEIFSSFAVFWLAAEDGAVQVQATLNYSGGREEQRVLILIVQDGAWRIDEILAPS
jgi:hypothetical protein